MKKILILAAMIAITACGCTSGTTNSSEKVQSTDAASENLQALTEQDTSLGDGTIEIGDFVLAKTYEDKDAIVINLKYTNNGEEDSNFMTSFSAKAYQNGVELSNAIIIDSEVYDSENQMKNLKQGGSIDVQVAYELDDLESDVEFEISELFSFNDKKLTKQFKISEQGE